MTAVTFGAWNVRTLLDRAGTNRPERRTALIAHELNRYNVEIAALSETRLADEGHLTEQSAGYTFFWIGRGQNERREAGVGFAINSNLARKLKLLERWAEHFDTVLNRPSTINEEAINRLPQVPVDESLADPPTEEEVSKAIKRLSSGCLLYTSPSPRDA